MHELFAAVRTKISASNCLMNCQKRALTNADSVRVVSENSFELGSSKPTTTCPFVRYDLNGVAENKFDKMPQ